jgi:hypothetical protein
MAFNPVLPADGALVIAAELRSQFTSLKSEIDTLNFQLASLVTQFNTDTPHNCVGVQTPAEQGFNSPTPEIQQIADKLNELITTLRR